MKFWAFKFLIKFASLLVSREDRRSFLKEHSLQQWNLSIKDEQMAACVQPRTETYEHLTCPKQREAYMKRMPPRVTDSQPISHYSDYEEAKAYHNGTKFS